MSSSSFQTRVTDGPDGLKIWSCTNCRRRKVRCDRQDPCAQCIKRDALCVFPVSGRLPPHHRNRGTTTPNVEQKHVGLMGRLRKLEAMVSELNTQFEIAATEGSDDSPTGSSYPSGTGGETQLVEPAMRRVDTEHDASASGDNNAAIKESEILPDFPASLDLQVDVGNLVTRENDDLVVGDGFWTMFCSEVEYIFEAVRDHSRPPFFAATTSSTEPHPERSHVGYYSFLKRQTSLVGAELCPLPSQVFFIWHVFEERIDPFVKFLHAPSMDDIIRSLDGDWASLEPGLCALILAVSFAVASVLDDEEVRVNFGAEKKDIVPRYRLGTEKALERADLLTTIDLRAVEACTIYLNILQNSGETGPAWVLLGALVRVAVRLQLHQDGSQFGDITEFEKERRRRLWWQICSMDSRATGSRSSNFSVSERDFDTKIPANINDTDISADISDVITSMNGRTDMTPSLIRYQLWRLSCQVRSCIATLDFDPSRALDLFRRGVKDIEDKYITYLDTGRPIDSLIVIMAKLSFARIELLLEQELASPRHSSSDNHGYLNSSGRKPSSEVAFSNSLLILEYTWALDHEPAWRPWRWLLGKSLRPWNALNTVVGNICSIPWKQEYSQAWSVAEKSYHDTPQSAKSMPQYQSLCRLMGQASLTVLYETQRTAADRDVNNLSTFAPYGHHQSPGNILTSMPVIHGQHGQSSHEGGLETQMNQYNRDILPDIVWDLEDWVNI